MAGYSEFCLLLFTSFFKVAKAKLDYHEEYLFHKAGNINLLLLFLCLFSLPPYSCPPYTYTHKYRHNHTLL